METFRKLLNSTFKAENSLNIRDPRLSEESSSSSESDEDSESGNSSEESMRNNFEQFIEGTSLPEYLERFDAYLLLNRVTDEITKTVHFIGICGPFLYSRIKSVCDPRAPMAVPFSELKTLMANILCPKNLVAVERAAFHSRKQGDDESATKYALALRKMAQTCDFGPQLESQLKDRFVVGLKLESTRTRVITSASMDEAVSLARTIEASHKLATPSTSFSSSESSVSAEINQFHQQRGFRPQRGFFRPRGNYQGRHRSQLADNRNRNSFCNKCGSKFCRSPCRAENYVCYHCEERGHISRLCPRRKVGNFEYGEDRIGKCLNLITEPPIFIVVNINNVNMKCEIDCGASVSVMSSAVYEKYFDKHPIYGIEKNFVMADDTKCVTCGVMEVVLNAKFKCQIVIVKSSRESAPLIGRTWLNILYPNWKSCFVNGNYSSSSVEVNNKIMEVREVDLKMRIEKYCDEIKMKYAVVFETHVTPIKNFLINLKLKPNAIPQFRKAASVPFALRENVSNQLKELEKNNIIEKVKFCDWGSQVVLAKKKNGEIRICCNFKPTLNPFLEQNEYPIPNVDDLLFTLNGNKFFSIIDLSGAYLQLALNEESRKLTTINTIHGLYSYKRLPFGVKTAPSIFQEVMEKILCGLNGVVSYFDDILIGGSTLEICKERTFAVLDRLNEFNVQANFNKCCFFSTKIEYLGHEISEKGVAPSSGKVQAVIEASSPRDLTSLRAFLGLLNFYSKFLPDLQPRLHPLHRLLQKEVKFEWSDECEEVFQKCKKDLINSPILSFYDPSKPLTIVCDAGPYGVGAILNVVENGIERPIYMASASLSEAEKNYAQLHREALAIVFALKKFHKFVFGHFVTIFTDCQPLPAIFSGKKDISTVINSRFLRWMLLLQNYDVEIRHRPKRLTVNADALSRLPCNAPTNVEIAKLSSFNNSCEESVTKKEIEVMTQSDSVLLSLYNVIKEGWPNKDQLSVELQPFFKFRDSLDVHEGCIYYGDRIFVPFKFRNKLLKSLHKQHKGIVKCKQAARLAFWWHSIDKDIENFIQSCESCQILAPNRQNSLTIPWPLSKRPFERVHIDHFFFNDKIFLIIVDDYSKWLDVKINKSVSSKCVLRSLREFIASVGLPEKIVSDNATCFNSMEFENFCKLNNIEHVNSPQYHPQSNGLAERFVGIVKNNLRKSLCGKNNVDEQLLEFLFEYRSNPLATDISPASVIFRYKFRNNLNSLSKQVQSASKNALKAEKQWAGTTKTTCWTSKPMRKFDPTEEIYYYLKTERKWVPGKIVKQRSKMCYEIELESGHIMMAHFSCLKRRK